MATNSNQKGRRVVGKTSLRAKGNRKIHKKSINTGNVQVYNAVTGNYVFRDAITNELVINRTSKPIAGLRVIKSRLNTDLDIDKDFAIKSEEVLVELFNKKRSEKITN